MRTQVQDSILQQFFQKSLNKNRYQAEVSTDEPGHTLTKHKHLKNAGILTEHKWTAI